MKRDTGIRNVFAAAVLAVVFIAAVPLLGMAAGDTASDGEYPAPSAATEPGETPDFAGDGEQPPPAEPSAEPPETAAPGTEEIVTPDMEETAVEAEPSLEPVSSPEAALLPGEVSIATAEELLALAGAVNSGVCEQVYGVPPEEVKAALTADIDLSGVAYTPIGTIEQPFCGMFDGAGHTISNLLVSGDTQQGLFGRVSGADIQNLNLAAASVSARAVAGGIAGYAENSRISNCLAAGTVLSDENYAGGIVGVQLSGAISGCETWDMTVSAVESAGGIAGGAGSLCVISDCRSAAAVSAGWFVGGIAGVLGEASAERCDFTGSVACDADNGGTIAGYIMGGALSGCSSSARVAGEGNITPSAQAGFIWEQG